MTLRTIMKDPGTAYWISEILDQLKASVNVESFRVWLRYNGPERGEVVHSVLLTAAPEAIDAAPTLIDVWLPKERAVRIIDRLAELGFFDRAKEFALQEAPPRAGIPKGPTYALMVEYSIENEKWHCYYLDLGWNRQMLQFLDDFRKGLVGAEAKAMDEVLAQLGPERRKWKAAKEADVTPAATEPEKQRSGRASLAPGRARQIAHDALSKALLEEYGDDARAMISADVSDERLSLRRETDTGWKETEGGKKAIWVALLGAKQGGYCGHAIIDDGNGAVLKLLIPTKAGREKALQRVQKWVRQKGAPAKIEWQPNGWYQMEWRVSEREMGLLGPFVISVHPTEGEPYVQARR